MKKASDILQLASGFLILLLVVFSCKNKTSGAAANSGFDEEMVKFEPYASNPVFTHDTGDAWDNPIRERGFILKEDSVYKMWYTGYKGDDTVEKYLGYATSPDGI